MTSEQARTEILDAIRRQSQRDNIELSTALWTLLNDHEDARLSPNDIGSLLDQIGDEEDEALELLFRYERSLSTDERKHFRKAVKRASQRSEYLAGFLAYVEFDDPSLSRVPRWLDVILLFVCGILLVAIVTAIALALPSEGSQAPKWARANSSYVFLTQNPVMVWLGRIALTALAAYALQFYVLKAWSRLRSEERE
jgi:hypothetical protein